MENIKTLYYERFIQHIVESYSSKLKAAKPGHCMKITGLAMKELRVLLPLLRPINQDMEVYILSEDERVKILFMQRNLSNCETIQRKLCSSLFRPTAEHPLRILTEMLLSRICPPQICRNRLYENL